MATTSDSEGILRELGEKDAAQDAGQPATSSASPPESSVPKAETGELETESPRTVTGLKWFFAYSSILSTVLLFALDGTIVADIQPSIVEAFNNVDLLPWIGVAFTLGSVSILPLGKAFGVFNVKWLFIGCVVGFEVGSAICGAAPNMQAMIIGRVIQGVTGSGVYSGGLTYIALTTTTRERPLYFSGVVAMWGAGSVLGPVIGGAFAESSATWRWAFYINLVVAAVFAPAFFFCLPNIQPLDLPLLERARSLDWLGILIFEGGVACYAMALTFGGVVYGFASGQEIALWTMTGVLLIAFSSVTYFHPGVPADKTLYPAHFLSSLKLNILQFNLFVASGSMMMTVYYVPLFFQFTRGDNALDAGVRLLPPIAMIIFFSVLNGTFMPKYGYYTPWYIFGNAALLAGSALMFTIDSSTSESRIYGYTILLGVGIGSTLTAGIAVAQALVPKSDVNNAVGFMTCAQNLGNITFLGVAGSLYQNFSLRELGSLFKNMPRTDILGLTTGISSSVYQALDEHDRGLVIDQVTVSIRNVFAIAMVGSAMGFLASIMLGRHKLY
ncbi:hypothetical protein N8I77_013393 [Diaporthe amygdali]|uniref:Major facilitator superfamily (MFS) profile domain-containing protein n=1 Tax=Phomopsis amygdali TaxID=1214568 RepID=A0AAD9S2N2_PHOAM|nr:hypothetical protein N8I77_013393 [Diaporthe amygdali]